MGHFGAHRRLSDAQREKRLGGKRFRLAGNFAIINPKCVWDAILEEIPYPVKMLFFISSNPVLTRANAREVYRALEKMDCIRGEVRPLKYEEKGFSTPTRKFELWSTLLETWGYDPLPRYREPPESPVITPEICASFPYTLITGARSPGFFHTENRQVPWLRELHRDPVVQIHPETARREGIQEGDWVVIESPRGKVRQRAQLFEGMDPRTVAAQHAGWFRKRRIPDTVGTSLTSTS